MDALESPTWREVVTRFINERMEIKLALVAKDNKLSESAKSLKQLELRQAYAPQAWLADASRRVNQIQLATHTLKPINPDARGTQVFNACDDTSLASMVGTHCIAPDQQALDVVGNAAALDVFKLLKLKREDDGPALLSRLQEHDPYAIQALDPADTKNARSLAAAFGKVTGSESAGLTHTLAKQVYFPLPNGQDHLLAPLYPTVLVHALHRHLRTERFGDAVKVASAARKAKLDGAPHRDYLGLLTQSFGGTKPQNISQLNSDRGGRAHLLAGLPPSSVRDQWFGPPLRHSSVFAAGGAFVRRDAVIDLVRQLREYLSARAGETGNLQVREHRAGLVDAVIDELIDFTARCHQLKAGWSLDDDCQLCAHQSAWLDPTAERAALAPAPVAEENPFWVDDDDAEAIDQTDWPAHVTIDFASWFNRAISAKNNPMQAAEAQQWRQLVRPKLLRMQKELADV